MLNGGTPNQIKRKMAYGQSGDGVQVITMTGTLTLSDLYEDDLNVDPGGASRNLDLGVTTERKGMSFNIFNAADQAETITLRNSAGSTIASIAQGGSVRVVYGGATPGWSKVIDVGANTGASLLSTANVWTGTNEFGVSGTGVDVTFYGDTATRDLVWDYSADALRAADNTKIGWGSGAGTTPDISFDWDGTRLNVTQLTANSEIRWGVDAAGIDQRFYGDTASTFMLWDQSADSLIFADNAKVVLGTGSDVTFLWDGTDLLVSQALADSTIKWGVSGAGINHVFYGDTAGRDLSWDQTNDQLLLADNATLSIGSGAGVMGDIGFSWSGTALLVSQLTANSAIQWGIDGAGIDMVLYGDTASAACTWDQSADSLILTGVAKIKCQTIAAATGTAIPVTHSGSFPITQNGAETNTLADPTFIGQWLSIFVDTDTSGARVITAASRINQAANTTITLTEVGDFIKLEAITIAGALKWQVVANDGAALS